MLDPTKNKNVKYQMSKQTSYDTPALNTWTMSGSATISALHQTQSTQDSGFKIVKG